MVPPPMPVAGIIMLLLDEVTVLTPGVFAGP